MRDLRPNEYLNHNGEIRKYPVGLLLIGWSAAVSFLIWLFFHA
jgi:hypothetical protein